MRKILFTFFFVFIHVSLSAQNTKNQSVYKNAILEGRNSWAIGFGYSSFMMHGDLRSIATANFGDFWNSGGYLYVDKMFNSFLGLEFKGNYNNISGGAQHFSDVYTVLYGNGITIRNNMFFEGKAYGAEFNLILSFGNEENFSKKWLISAYLGAGYHEYDSKLFERNADGTRTLHVDFGDNPIRGGIASSIYLTGQLGLKYRLSKRIDFELRGSMSFNSEDHLDATISNKQNWESFFTTHLGIAIKLGKNDSHIAWRSSKRKHSSFDNLPIELVDADGDGVMNRFDIEPNTPKGVKVYGNGVSVDSDLDGTPDHRDDCPFKPGTFDNKGCPDSNDSDGDGVYDDVDLCPNVPGRKENRGCPDNQNTQQQLTIQNIYLLSGNVFFDTAKDKIRKKSHSTLNRIAKLIKELPSKINFIIEGHTDNVDGGRYNTYLSRRRAANVRRYLINKGVNPDRLTFKGYGETRPKFSNETPEGRQLNRRVEIHPVNENIEDPNPNGEDKNIDPKLHIVKFDDTLYSIAQMYKTTVEELQRLNNMGKKTTIITGQILKIKE